MIFDEGRDEVVTVIVAVLVTQGERLAHFPASGFEELRSQLLLMQEFVCQPLIYEDLWIDRLASRFQQLHGIVLRPARAIVAEVTRQSLLTPRTACRGTDRRES